ncbi:MAG: RsmB/NOP family class I SAM-dependent RNA methyltransferase [Candidatus Marinimicrobia bacterium]|nr:RsmB/NOP family class I SAM-dependent RNA methyltransferase [Candidatus Neomarinimicrobiota bacterium]
MNNFPFLLSHTAELLDLWMAEGNNTPADILRRHFFHERPYLGARDRRFIDFLYFDIIRNLRLYRWQVRENGSGDEPESAILTVHAFFVRFPGQAQDLTFKIEDLTAELFRRYAYRNIFPEDPAVRYSLPETLWQHIRDTYPAVQLEACLQQLLEPSQMHIRVNSLKSSPEKLRQEMATIPFQEGRISPSALRCEQYQRLDSHPLFRGGYFEFQDESSQLTAFACAPRENDTVIDLCAGAGGKSLHLATLKKDRGTVIATDIAPRRMEELRRRVKRAGLRSVRCLTLKRLKQDYMGKADLLLIDAPCSGSGVYGRHPGRKWELNTQKLNDYCRIQEEILDEYAGLLKTGGSLVYATCSIIPEENAMQINRFLKKHPNFRPQSLEPAFREYQIPLSFPDPPFMRQILPQEFHSDGFFIAKTIKTS